MDSIEVCGKTVDEAVLEGLEKLGINKDEAEIEILEEPQSKGLIFKKTTLAKVKITKKKSDSARAVEFLDGLFDLIKVHATTEVTRDDDKICINLVASNSSFLIGYRGEVLDALQCLAGAVANIGREEYKRVVVDCEQYREKRENTLNSLALKLADKAVVTGRKVNLEPMNPFERRIIHTALSSRDDVKTESEGKEPNRYIVIIPNDLRDDRPISAERRSGGRTDRGFKPYDKEKNGFERHGGKERGGYRSGGRTDRNDRRSGYRGEKRSSGMYGKPKDKSNVTSFGTFIGNSNRND